MCGIAGKLYFNQFKEVSNDEILRMTGVIAHRGPDDEGVFVSGNVGLGHRRLSIIDLSPAGHQPMSDSEQQIWITFNGEIYNFIELKNELEKDGIKFRSRSDTEVIIYLYKKYGPECVKRLRGMFAFAIWDGEKKQLFIARDRLGKKPIKYYFDSRVFVFASELKAILKNEEVKKEIDFEAIDEYLTYGYVPAPKTGIKNIWKLEPAHYIIVRDDGRMEKKQYWDIDFDKKTDLNENEWMERVTQKLKECVKIRLLSDVPLGAHLSGGVDSSLIAAFMAEQSIAPIKTYSVGFGLPTDELKYARLVADRYHTDHHELIVNPDASSIIPKLVYHYEEPFADTSALPTWFLCQGTASEVTVALNGDGGDESFAGYNRYLAVSLYKLFHYLPAKKILAAVAGRVGKNKIQTYLKSFSKTPLEFYLNATSYFTPLDKAAIYSQELNDRVQNSRWKSYSEKFLREVENSEWLDRFLYLGFKTHLPDQLLAKVDIASMAHGLEVRSPLLDHELVELMARAPSRLKLRGLQKKYLLKKIAYKYLPRECIDRPKQGFDVPLEAWLKGKFKPMAEEKLLDNNFLSLGFKQDFLRRLIDNRLEGRQNNDKRIWTLMMLAEWVRVYFK